MPSRRLPIRNESRYIALLNAKTKADNTPGQTVIQAATLAKLGIAVPELQGLLQNSQVALAAQTGLTDTVEGLYASGKLWYSQLIQHLNDAIAREEFTPNVRAYYGIAVSDTTVPAIISYNDMIYWGSLLISGEAARVAAGGVEMTFPTVEEFEIEHFNVFKSKLNLQSAAKDAYDDALEAIQSKNPGYDELIRRTWNEVELAFDHEAPPSKRRNAREWGVIYTANKGEKVKLTIPAASTVTADDFNIENGMDLRAKNTGTVDIMLCRSNTSGDACLSGIVIAAGTTVTFTSANLGDSGQYLNATNGHSSIEGKVEVERL